MNQQENDIPAPRTIRVGSASVGLVGLDPALKQALAGQISEEAAADQLLATISRHNYVPGGAKDLYRQALLREYRKRLGLEAAGPGDALTIRVLGSGCVTCNTLTAMLFEALQKFGLAADMESVHDPDEIGRFGVTRTPALIINGRTRCSGRMPVLAEVEEWIKEEAEGLGNEARPAISSKPRRKQP